MNEYTSEAAFRPTSNNRINFYICHDAHVCRCMQEDQSFQNNVDIVMV